VSSEGRGEKMEEEGNSIAYAELLTLKTSREFGETRSHKPLSSTFEVLRFINQNYDIRVIIIQYYFNNLLCVFDGIIEIIKL